MEIDHNGKLAIDGFRRTIDSNLKLVTRHLWQFGFCILHYNFILKEGETGLLQEFLSIESTLILDFPVLSNACRHVKRLGAGKLRWFSRGLHQSGNTFYLVPFRSHLWRCHCNDFDCRNVCPNQNARWNVDCYRVLENI
jgi:hypothetical protein